MHHDSSLPDIKNLDAGLPASIDGERTILGAVLLEPELWSEVEEKLRSEDFSLDSHKRIALAMKQLHDAGTSIDIVTLADNLAKSKGLESCGGVAYLASLTEGLPLRPVIEDYIKIIKDKSILRRIILVSSAAIARASDQGETALEILSDLSTEIEAIAEPVRDNNSGPVANFIAEARINFNREYSEKITPCIPSGIDWFDQKAGGYRLGRITLVCARPNVGKTPWCLQSIAHHCKRGKKTVFFSLEQDREEVLRNLLPWVTDLPNRVCSRPELQNLEQNQQSEAGWEALLGWNLHIFDGDMDVERICWVMDREAKDSNEEVLFALDHFGKIAGGATGKDTRGKYNENSERIRRKIKKLRNAAMLELCQLRKVNREFWNKPPVTDDIKESGNLFEDAYACVMLHRPIDEESQKMSRTVDVNLAKLRAGGSTGMTKGKFSVRRLEFITQAELELPQDDRDDEEFFA